MSITQLYPLPGGERPLEGTYLSHNLHLQHKTDGPFVYSNFVVSLDGRIAISSDHSDGLTVPESTSNDRDWRLFQELAAQADLIITSGRYLRDWAQGKAQEILQVDDPQFADLRHWREAHGLRPQADIAVISQSLDFPVPDILTAGGRKTTIFTTADPDPIRMREIEKHTGQVIIAGNRQSVNGEAMIGHMANLGYRTIYSASGPKILRMLLASNVLNRLYITHAHRILGGDPFASIVEGKQLEPAVNMKLNSLFLDATGLDGLGQLFSVYDCV